MITMFKYLSALIIVLLLAGCSKTIQPLTQKSKKAFAPDHQAIKLEQQQDFLGAAKIYLALAAKANPPQKQQYQLRAVANFLHQGDKQTAEKYLLQIEPQYLSSLEAYQARLFSAEIALAKQKPQQTLGLLEDLPHPKLSRYYLQLYYYLKSQAYALTGNALASAKAGIALDKLLKKSDFKLKNQQNILLALNQLTDTALQLAQPQKPNTLSGWMDLARLLKQYGRNQTLLQQQYGLWRQRYPRHPVLAQLLVQVLQQPAIANYQVQHLAIILPNYGKYQQPSQVFLNGFISSYYQQSSKQRPSIQIYYHSPNNVIDVYQQAVANNVDFVIGSLDKQANQQLLDLDNRPKAILSLNPIPTKAHPTAFYQFGLSPENEARQVAEKAWFDGHTHAVMLTPNNSWGQRMAQSFERYWQASGGTILEQQSYQPRTNDYNQTIRQLLNIDESKQRLKLLQNFIGQPLKGHVRIRQDADFIFIAASASDTRSILPQLKFNYAGKLPVYSTSHSFSGIFDQQQAKDLEGLIFCDLPWILEDDPNALLSKNRVLQLWPTLKPSHLRLYAMGMDAYFLPAQIAYLQQNPTESFKGKTGNLYVDGQGKIYRQLLWAKLKSNHLTRLGYSPQTSHQSDYSYLFSGENQNPLAPVP